MKKIISWKDEPLDENKIEKFMDKVQKMADAEFGVDDEGDSSLRLRCTDRTRCESDHFWPQPYAPDEPDAEKLSAYLERALFNLSVAFDRVNLAQRLMQSERHLRDKKP